MRKKSNVVLTLAVASMIAAFSFTGCGNSSTGTTTGTTMEGSTDTGTTTGSGTPTTAGDADNAGDTVGNVADDVGDAVGDVAKGVGDAAGDVAKGVGDGVGDLVDGGFETYDDAHDYLIGRFQDRDSKGRYEVRNESKTLNEYDKGKQGYRFEIYDTSSKKANKVGTFYVDSSDGSIHKINDKTKAVEEYNFNS